MCETSRMIKILSTNVGVNFNSTMSNDLIEKLADSLHVLWMENMSSEGWTYDPEFNEDKRTHPCMLSWSKLPDSGKQNDNTMARFVALAMSKAGLSVVMER